MSAGLGHNRGGRGRHDLLGAAQSALARAIRRPAATWHSECRACEHPDGLPRSGHNAGRPGLLDLHAVAHLDDGRRSEAHTSELQSLLRTSYAVFFLKIKTT